MAHIYNLYVNENRTVSNDIKTPVMTRDHMVHDIVVHIPAEVDGTDMGSWFWYFVFVTPKRQKYAIPLALESVTVDDEESYNEYQATVNIGHAITNTSGKVQYAVEAVKTNSSGFVVNEWHTCTYSINIVKTLCREDADAPQQDVYVSKYMRHQLRHLDKQ